MNKAIAKEILLRIDKSDEKMSDFLRGLERQIDQWAKPFSHDLYLEQTERKWIEEELGYSEIRKHILSYWNTLSILREKFENIATGTITKLSLPQIALIHVYSNKQISRSNCNQIANEYGHSSGEKLYHKFIEYSSSANRKGIAETAKKTSNKIELIQSIVSELASEHQKKALLELTYLQANYKEEFE